jgi:hypothetical protein
VARLRRAPRAEGPVTARLERSSILLALYVAWSLSAAVVLLRLVSLVIAYLRGDRSTAAMFLSAATIAALGVGLALAFRRLGALRTRWGVDFRRPGVRRATFDV